MGMGLLVRFLSHAKKGGGDLRLAAPQPFFRTLLDATKLSTIFRIYDSEEEAIVSFLKEPASLNKQTTPAGPLVLFVDQSPDLCAFVRTLLNGHGYEVLSTCRLHDAKLLLSAADVACLVLGPDCSPSPSQQVAATLRPLAKRANLIQLDSGFKQHDAEKAGLELLRRIQGCRLSVYQTCDLCREWAPAMQRHASFPLGGLPVDHHCPSGLLVGSLRT